MYLFIALFHSFILSFFVFNVIQDECKFYQVVEQHEHQKTNKSNGEFILHFNSFCTSSQHYYLLLSNLNLYALFLRANQKVNKLNQVCNKRVAYINQQ